MVVVTAGPLHIAMVDVILLMVVVIHPMADVNRLMPVGFHLLLMGMYNFINYIDIQLEIRGVVDSFGTVCYRKFQLVMILLVSTQDIGVGTMLKHPCAFSNG